MKNAIRFMFFAGIWFLLIVCFESDTSARQNDEKRIKPYMTASEIVCIATKAYPKGLMTGMAIALPVATKKNSRLQIVVLLYKESTKRGDETIYPPHHILAIDPISGKVLRNEPCTPQMFGLNQAVGIPVVGFGLDPGLSAEVFWKKHDRFMELSPEVWKAYASGASHLTQQGTQLVREYSGIFNIIAKKPLLPYYHAVAADFFKWLDGVAQ